jgi:Asp-tRNA(Asn)/Glu-tRNA(Gln) amidotransferase A subunit family amidase
LRGPLHGIPIVVKDMWQLHPESGVPCTAGMEALRGARHGGDGSALVKTVSGGRNRE